MISNCWNYIFEHSFINEELQIKEIETENFQHLVIICEVFLPNGKLYIPTTTNYFQIVHDAIKEMQMNFWTKPIWLAFTKDVPMIEWIVIIWHQYLKRFKCTWKHNPSFFKCHNVLSRQESIYDQMDLEKHLDVKLGDFKEAKTNVKSSIQN